MTSAAEIAEFVGAKLPVSSGDTGRRLTGYGSIDGAAEDELTFCTSEGDEGREMIRRTRSRLVISGPGMDAADPEKIILCVENPRLWFIKCVYRYFAGREESTGIHPSAVVLTGDIGKGVSIGPFSYVEEGVSIGDGAKIHDHVTILRGTVIGSGVEIWPGARIGIDGFGYERDDDDLPLKFPHRGGVRIGDRAEIGANACIDKGTIRDTVVGEGTKLDDLVHVAHNTVIGKNCTFAGNVLTGGGCRIGDGCHVATGVTFRNGTSIGKNTMIGVGATVTGNLGDEVVAYGTPAKAKDYPERPESIRRMVGRARE